MPVYDRQYQYRCYDDENELGQVKKNLEFRTESWGFRIGNLEIRSESRLVLYMLYRICNPIPAGSQILNNKKTELYVLSFKYKKSEYRMTRDEQDKSEYNIENSMFCFFEFFLIAPRY